MASSPSISIKLVDCDQSASGKEVLISSTPNIRDGGEPTTIQISTLIAVHLAGWIGAYCDKLDHGVGDGWSIGSEKTEEKST